MNKNKGYFVEYYSDKLVKQNIFTAIKEMFVSLSKSKELIWRLFVRDFSAKFRQSLLGLLWVFILPVVSVSFFILLNKAGVLNIGQTDIPYILFALTGITIWQLFSSILINASNSLVNAGGMITKINFPKATLVFAAAGPAIVEFLIRLVMLFGLMVYFQKMPAVTILFVPLIMICLILLALAFGFMLAILTGLIRDIPNVLNLVMTFLMFLTPVLYPKTNAGIFESMNRYNPLSYYVNSIRDFFYLGIYQNLLGLYVVLGGSVLLFFISWRIFILVEPRIAERV